MALCFAHAVGGYLAYEAVRPAGRHRPALLAAAVVLANAPDFDFLPGIVLGRPGAFHRGVSHTVLAAAAVAVAAGLLAAWRRWGPRPGWWARFAALAYGSHLVLDFFTVDVVAPHGARFLWPFWDAWLISPLTVLREIIVDPTTRGGFLWSVVSRETWPVWAGELGLLVAVVALVHGARALRTAPALAGAEVGEEP